MILGHYIRVFCYTILTQTRPAVVFCARTVARSQRHYLNSTALNKLNAEVWGGLSDDGILARLRLYIQASSSLSFAANGQEFTDSHLRQLHERAKVCVRIDMAVLAVRKSPVV